MTISADLQKIYAGSDNRIYMEALTIRHPYILTKRVVNVHNPDHVAWELQTPEGLLEEFEFLPFELKLPAMDNQGNQDLEILMCNVGKEMIDVINDASQDPTSPIQVEYSVYIAENQSAPQIEHTILSVV